MAARTYTVVASDGARFTVAELVRTQLVEDGHTTERVEEDGVTRYFSPLDAEELERAIHRARGRWGAWIS